MNSSRNCAQGGFSLLELVVVMAMSLVVAAVAAPNVMNTLANARLRSGISTVSGAVQSTRMLAVKNNKTYTARYTTNSSGAVVYTDLDNNGSFDVGEPIAQLGSTVSLSSLPVSGTPSALDSTLLGFTPTTGVPPSFNSRGIPADCSSSPCTPNQGFVYYFTDQRPLNGNGWAALSITPAGRIKVWIWNGSSWSD
jgi:prepilin-type N-terminal cleavage/methylation domain-containing protein